MDGLYIMETLLKFMIWGILHPIFGNTHIKGNMFSTNLPYTCKVMGRDFFEFFC